MDIDQVLEVPDTPDRLASQNINGTGCTEKDSNSSAAGDSENARFSDDGFRNWPRCRTKLVIGNGHSRSLSFRPSRNLSISGKSDCHINSTVPTVGNSSSLKNTHLCRRTLADQNPKYEKKQLLDSQHMEKGKSWRTSESSACQEDNGMVDLTEQNKHAPVFKKAVPHEALGNPQVDETRKGSMSTGSLPSFYSMSKSPSSNASKGKAKVEDKGKVSSGFDHQKVFDIHCNSQPKAGNTMSASLNPITSGRVIGQKRLVRNGCISPHNIAKARQSAEKHNYHPIDVSKTMASDCPVNPADVSDFICKGNNSYMVKGKGIIEHPFPLKEPETKTTDLFGRSSTISEKAKETCDATGDAFRCVEGLGRWRSTRNRTKTNQHHGNRVESRENRNGSGNRTGDDCTSFRDAVSHQSGSASPLAQKSSDDMSHFGQIDGHYHAERTFTKRQKRGSTLSNQGECSMSSYGNSEIVLLGSSGEPSNSRPTRNQSRRGMRISNPVIEIDEFSPGTRNSGSHNIDCSVNDDSDVRARQVEADELLARELQEQLYNEVTGFGVDEIDTHIALALQQEENSRNSFSGGTRVFHPRGSLVSNLYRRSQSRPSRNPSIQRGTQPRVPTSTRMARLRGRLPSQPRSSRTPLFPPSMDVDMRIHILETLEAFSDMEMATAGSFVQVQRDFNENDYEMLLALDENNHSVGASLNQINGLPQSTVQTNNFEEACAICLETPTTGDTIRHLPCLHKFHKDCIDPWLQRRTTCPVCKSSIT